MLTSHTVKLWFNMGEAPSLGGNVAIAALPLHMPVSIATLTKLPYMEQSLGTNAAVWCLVSPIIVLPELSLNLVLL